MEFARYLKQLREKNNLSIRQLALYSNVSAGYLSQIESGTRGIPSPEVIKKVSKALKVSYEDLMKAAGYLTKETSSNYKSANDQHIFEDLDPELARKFVAAVKNPLEELFFADILSVSKEEREKIIREYLKVRRNLRKE